MPRGIDEGAAAGLTPLPSHIVSVPGIAECAVNLECRVELVRRQYTHNAVFLKVVGASVHEELLGMDRQAIIRRLPTYEVDDIENKWHGAIERLGTNHDLLECPGFPVSPREGPKADVAAWVRDLSHAGLLSTGQAAAMLSWVKALEGQETSATPASAALRRRLTRALELAAWEQWTQLRQYIAAEPAA
jgi:hypothetical protein